VRAAGAAGTNRPALTRGSGDLVAHRPAIAKQASSAFRKLGVSSRGELAARGILPRPRRSGSAFDGARL
jgi:hypothetical protein